MVKTSCSPEDYPKFGVLPKEIVSEKINKLKEWIWSNEVLPPPPPTKSFTVNFLHYPL